MIVVPFHTDEPLDAGTLPGPGSPLVAPVLPEASGWQRMAVLHDEVAAAVAAAEGQTTVVSGDCTTALGVLAGLQRRGLDPGVVWLDAHGDFNTDETSPSGYLGGMPLAVATGLGDATVRDRTGLRPLPAERVLLVGARAVDPGEQRLLEGAGVPQAPVDGAATALPDGPLYLHVDLDVLDPEELAGLRYPEAGGCRLDALADAVAAVVASGRVAAFGYAATWHPGRVDRAAAQRVSDALLGAAGALRR